MTRATLRPPRRSVHARLPAPRSRGGTLWRPSPADPRRFVFGSEPRRAFCDPAAPWRAPSGWGWNQSRETLDDGNMVDLRGKDWRTVESKLACIADIEMTSVCQKRSYSSNARRMFYFCCSFFKRGELIFRNSDSDPEKFKNQIPYSVLENKKCILCIATVKQSLYLTMRPRTNLEVVFK